MEYIVDKNIRVSNNSWGGEDYSQSFYDTIQASQAVGHIFVASAGNKRYNTDETYYYPAGYDLPNIITVAATDMYDDLAAFSSYGPTTVDLAAPGVLVFSTELGTGYGYANGTSMAAPHVAGVVALLMSRRPDLTWQQARERIMNSVRPVYSLFGITATGGVVSAVNVGDCNQNGIDDELDIVGGTSQDCSGNGLPDECEADCNGNSVPDSCDIFSGASDDCNGNAIPDECEPDCNENGIADSCDFAGGGSEDCNQDVVPDECQLGVNDCNGNTVPDDCDIAGGFSDDCTVNDIPDECELLPDCNGNGTADRNDICNGVSADCNRNRVPDECDVTNGTSEDCTGDFIPDECEVGLQILVMSGAASDYFLAAIKEAGHFITRATSFWDLLEPLPYDVIIWTEDAPALEYFASALDEFVGAGGGLVLMRSAYDYGGFTGAASPIAGHNQDWLIRLGTQVVDFDSPLVVGLGATSTLEGNSTTSTLKPDAKTVITWDDGVPMAVTYSYGDGRTVYFNDLWAYSSGNWIGDPPYGTQLMHNALDYLATPAGDCNANGLPDSCEIAAGTLADEIPVGGDGIPDECQSDCNRNGNTDESDVADGISRDCNLNMNPDECDIAALRSEDCDANNVPDECELQHDCNDNGIHDPCDLSGGFSMDANGNGVPDECDVIVFVNADAVLGGDGMSWQTAHSSLQDALAETTATEIWIADGTYKPAGPGGDREATFQLRSGVRIYGGFAGGEARLDQRDPATNLTILSGDLNGDDDPDPAPALWRESTRSDNSYHVLTGHGTDATARVDGVIITAGNASELTDATAHGGGLWNRDGSPTLVDCVFVSNGARGGGGVYSGKPGTLTLINCAFIGNAAFNGGGISAGGETTLVNCVFNDNYGESSGAAVYSADYWTERTLINCTLVGNWGGSAAGVMISDGHVTLRNCILWGNTVDGETGESAQIELYTGWYATLDVGYSCIQGWTGDLGGVHNTGYDPLLMDADGPDDIPGTGDELLFLSSGSPCIDAGENLSMPAAVAVDVTGASRYRNDTATPDTGKGVVPIVDLGAYEYDADCNDNGISDAWDLAAATSEDVNDNGVPDECEARTNRYLSFVHGAGTDRVAYQVTLTASLEFPSAVSASWWVAAPGETGVSLLENLPVFRDWSSDGKLIRVADCEVGPASTYAFRATSDGITFGDPVQIGTIRRPGGVYYGDVVGIGTGDLLPYVGFTPPNGAVNVSDVQAYILTAQGSSSPSAPTTWIDLHGLGAGSPPNYVVNVADLQRIKFGFEGQRYADSPEHLSPADCP